VFNTTFNNVSFISWQLVLLVEETGVPGENHRPAASHWQTWSHSVVSSTSRQDTTLVVSGTGYIGICKSNNYAMPTTTAPWCIIQYDNSFKVEHSYDSNRRTSWESVALILEGRNRRRVVLRHVWIWRSAVDCRGGSRGGGGAPGARAPLKLEKNMNFWRKIVIFHTKYLKNVRASLRNGIKYDFFGVNSWFFTRNTQKYFAPPSARRNFLSAPPPNLKSWIRPWIWLVNVRFIS
jgi:hypothetical protein